MAADGDAATHRAATETARPVRVRIASVRPGGRVVVTASRYRCSLPGHVWDGRSMAWPEKPPGGQLATVQAVDGYNTLFAGMATDVVLLTTLGVVHGGGGRTIWRLPDHPPAAAAAE